MEFQVYLDAPMFKLFKKEGGGRGGIVKLSMSFFDYLHSLNTIQKSVHWM